MPPKLTFQNRRSSDLVTQLDTFPEKLSPLDVPKHRNTARARKGRRVFI